MVGCGSISNRHANAANNSTMNMYFTTCCDINEELAYKWKEKYNCNSYYTDYIEMIEKEDLDGVVLCTWPIDHREQIEGCINRGIKNILCEKSLALNGKEAAEILNLANENNVLIMEGFMYRHHPAIRKLEMVLSNGEIGEVDSIRAAFNMYDPEDESKNDLNRGWRNRKECGGGVPYDMTCYCVNACNHFSKSLPQRIYASGG